MAQILLALLIFCTIIIPIVGTLQLITVVILTLKNLHTSEPFGRCWWLASGQKLQTQIRLLLLEQSDLGLQFLLWNFCLNLRVNLVFSIIISVAVWSQINNAKNINPS